LRIENLRKELEKKLRKEQEIIDLKESYAKMEKELTEMKKKVEEAEGKAAVAI
jgi:flagellar motility protein MotE (MotC chaperone)